MDKVLEAAGLLTLLERFKEERIDPELVLTMTDAELTRLGVTTIGDRIRLRTVCRDSNGSNPAETTASTSASTTSQATSSRSTSVPSAASVAAERARLFNPRHARGTAISRKRKASEPAGRTWTAKIFCLADRHQTTLPTASARQVLYNAGLGLKKIKFLQSDNEEQVAEKFMSAEKSTGEETVGFPQLRDGGGFELLQCQSNCRQLTMIKCQWSVKHLKANIGGQSKIYVRPIQRSLSTKPVKAETVVNVKQMCEGCNKEFPMFELRDHLYTCTAGVDSSTDSDTGDADFHDNENTVLLQRQDQNPSGNNTNVVTNDELQINETDGEPPVTSVPETDVNPPQVDLTETDDVTVVDQVDLEPGAATEITNQLPEAEDINSIVNGIVRHCQENLISSTKEVVRLMQYKVVQGRSLEIENEDVCPEGETNYISVDRLNILETGMEEIAGLENLFFTLEVQFYGEVAQDYGGPRKEFFRLMLLEIKEKYFDQGLRHLLADEYICVGTIMGLSILQNGKLPQFLTDDLLTEMFESDVKANALQHLIKGLEKLGIFQLCQQIPSLREIFKPNPLSILTLRKINTLLVPQFSPNGSNKRRYEASVYSVLCKYMREVAAGRRGDVTLGWILQFATSCDEEPLLGFKIAPSIRFAEVMTSFLPTANTCINSMTLPYASHTSKQLPAEDVLFGLYDEAFFSNYFGNV